MRVTVVTTWFPSDRSPGAGSFVLRDVRALATEHDVRVVHLVAPALDDGRRSFAIDGIPVVRVPVDVRTPSGALAARRAVTRHTGSADIVHTMAAPALLPFLLRRPRAPWVHTEHWSRLVLAGAADESRVERLARPLMRRLASAPDEVVAVSAALGDPLRSLRSGPVSVIGNIVDPLPAVERTRPARPREIRVVAAANVVERKGWRLAVDAVSRLRRSGTSAELLWLGDGPQATDLARAGSDVLVRTPRRVGRDELAQELADADVFVLPTDVESFSLVTVEALSAGVPVVASGVGAHLDFLAPGTGVAVERSAEALAHGVAEAAGYDRQVVRDHGASLLARFGEQSYLRAYARVYERVCR